MDSGESDYNETIADTNIESVKGQVENNQLAGDGKQR